MCTTSVARSAGRRRDRRIDCGGRSLVCMTRWARAAAATGAAVGLGYYLVVTGKLTLDTGLGRRVRPLGPFGVDIAAPAETVFDVIAAPYLGRTPRAMSGKLMVLERGADMVLAEHYTPVHGGRLTAATPETVSFDRPRRVWFPLVRRPLAGVTKGVTLTPSDGKNKLGYSRDLCTDSGTASQ